MSGFLGTDSPDFYQYYKDAKTAFALLLPSVSLGYDTAYDTVLFFAPMVKTVFSTRNRTFLVRYVRIYRSSCGDGRLSRVPVHPFPDFDVFSDPGRTATARLYRSVGVAPMLLTIKASTFIGFRGSLAHLHQSLFTLHAPVSGYYAKLASGG